MSSKSAKAAWHFSFGLERDGPGLVTVDQANEFMDAIVSLAEARGLVVGGGYSAFDQASSEKSSGEA
jgi:hypothetical protein